MFLLLLRISKLLTLLRHILWTSIWSILVNVQWHLKRIYSVTVESIFCKYQFIGQGGDFLNLLYVYLQFFVGEDGGLVLSIIERGKVEYFTMIVQLILLLILPIFVHAFLRFY